MSRNAEALLTIYTNKLNRAVSEALAAHVPSDTASDAVRDAARTIAVGVLAYRLRQLIQAAPDHAEKGGRERLMALARDTLEGRLES